MNAFIPKNQDTSSFKWRARTHSFETMEDREKVKQIHATQSKGINQLVTITKTNVVLTRL